MLNFFRLFAVSALLAFVGIATTSAYAADVCPQGKDRAGHIAYKICGWKTNSNLQWSTSESRGKKNTRWLYKNGTLNSSVNQIEFGLRGLKPLTKVRLFRTVARGTVQETVVTSDKEGATNVIIVTSGGQGTLWVPNSSMTGEHYVNLRAVEGFPKLTYNHPQTRWFTKAGEDVFPSGNRRYAATRLNTSW